MKLLQPHLVETDHSLHDVKMWLQYVLMTALEECVLHYQKDVGTGWCLIATASLQLNITTQMRPTHRKENLSVLLLVPDPTAVVS